MALPYTSRALQFYGTRQRKEQGSLGKNNNQNK